MKNQMDRLQYRKGGLIQRLLKKGDTLFSIAEDNNLSITELLEVNPQIKNPDMIYAGDKIFIPGKETKIENKQESLLSRFREKAKEIGSKLKRENIKLPEKERPELRKRILPINMRQLAYDVFGGDDDLTEIDLSPEEFNAAKEVVKNALQRKSNVISYTDYQTVPEGMKSVYDDPAYADVGGSIKGSQGVIKKSFNDPKYALKTTIGQARITKNDKGETIIEDQYNFNEKSWKDRSFSIEGLKTFLGDMKNVIKQPEYFGPRMLGSYLGSGPGQGSMVKINLGVID
jgi:hypothetical protein